MRIVILAHGHPDLRAGGAERAAYSLFSSLKQTPGVEPLFIATSTPANIGHDGAFGAFRARRDEFLWAPPPIEWFKLSSLQYDLLYSQCKQLVETLRPDVIHVHHYAGVGVEVFPIFRALGCARLVLTLHEYMLICNHYGQMLRKGSNELCYASSPAECATCFPEYTSGKFFLRERFIKNNLDAVDLFVSPSAFLKRRFVDWGIAQERIRVIENLLPDQLTSALTQSPSRAGMGRIRLGFFGQLTPFKGAPLLIRALSALDIEDQNRVELIIFGGNPDDWPEVHAEIERLIDRTKVKVSIFGRYRNEDVIELMRGVDWVVLPSTWWENSPLVIQEARVAGVPVLTANIGGMREKVMDGVTGRHFLAGSELDLTQKIAEIIKEPKRAWSHLVVSAHNGFALDEHLRAYRDILQLEPQL